MFREHTTIISSDSSPPNILLQKNFFRIVPSPCFMPWQTKFRWSSASFAWNADASKYASMWTAFISFMMWFTFQRRASARTGGGRGHSMDSELFCFHNYLNIFDGEGREPCLGEVPGQFHFPKARTSNPLWADIQTHMHCVVLHIHGDVAHSVEWSQSCDPGIPQVHREYSWSMVVVRNLKKKDNGNKSRTVG